MINIFRQKEDTALQTPRNLPDLAKDILENEPIGETPARTTNPQAVIETPVKQDTAPMQFIQQAPVVESPAQSSLETASHPVKAPQDSFVPRLDLNLIRKDPAVVESDVRPPSALHETPSSRTYQEDVAGKSADVTPIRYQGERLFMEDIERLLVSDRNAAMQMLNNSREYLDAYHSSSMKELIDLERLWLLLEKRNAALKYACASIKEELVEKASALGSSGKTKAAGFNHPVFVPLKPKQAPFVDGRRECSDEVAFRFNDTRTARSLEQLYNILIQSSDDTYLCHVGSARNDFSTWIDEVFEEHDLAVELRGSTSRESFLQTLARRAGI